MHRPTHVVSLIILFHRVRGIVRHASQTCSFFNRIDDKQLEGRCAFVHMCVYFFFFFISHWNFMRFNGASAYPAFASHSVSTKPWLGVNISYLRTRAHPNCSESLPSQHNSERWIPLRDRHLKTPPYPVASEADHIWSILSHRDESHGFDNILHNPIQSKLPNPLSSESKHLDDEKALVSIQVLKKKRKKNCRLNTRTHLRCPYGAARRRARRVTA